MCPPSDLITCRDSTRTCNLFLSLLPTVVCFRACPHSPRGVGLMAWAIRRSVFSSHAIWPNDLNTLRLMAWKHAIWPDYLNTLRLMAWKHAIWPTFLYSTSTRPGEGAIYRYLSHQGKIAGDIHETKSSGLSLS